MAGTIAAHGADYLTTMHCQHQIATTIISEGPGRTDSWSWHSCHEYELPQSFVAGRVQFAAYSFGMAGLQSFAQWEITRHGHRKLARAATEISIGLTFGQAIKNRINQ